MGYKMFKLNKIINTNILKNFNKCSLFNQKYPTFSLLLNNNFHNSQNFLNINTNIHQIIPENIQIQNIEKIQKEKNQQEEIIEFANKTRNLAARKRRKRKTGKKISLRWR